MRINVEEVLRNEKERNTWNAVEFSTIDFYINNVKIEIPKEKLEEWKLTGLSNTSFITTYDFPKSEDYINFNNFPIFIHDDSVAFNELLLEPGIHYAINNLKLFNIEDLKNQIRIVLTNAINTNYVPAGYKTGKTNTKHPFGYKGNTVMALQDYLYEKGINPVRINPNNNVIILFGQRFINIEGFVEQIYNHNHLSREFTLNPNFKLLEKLC